MKKVFYFLILVGILLNVYIYIKYKLDVSIFIIMLIPYVGGLIGLPACDRAKKLISITTALVCCTVYTFACLVWNNSNGLEAFTHVTRFVIVFVFGVLIGKVIEYLRSFNIGSK